MVGIERRGNLDLSALPYECISVQEYGSRAFSRPYLTNYQRA